MQQHNLEGTGFEEVVSESGIAYARFRESLHPRYGIVAFDIIKGYFFAGLIVALLLLAGTRYPNWWWLYVPVGAVLLGYTAAYLALFIHEAGHFNIHPDKKINDRLATLFLCLPFGLSIRSYRKIHWQHHVHLGTPQDTEVSYFHPLNNLFFAETLTGIHLLRTLRRKDKPSVLTPAQQRESRRMLVVGALLHVALLTTVFLAGHWPFALAWIAAFGIFFPFFASLRQLLEHRDEQAHHAVNFFKEPHGKLSRLFVHTLFSSSFGAAGFTRHMIHHWDPQVSYTRLGEIEAFLAGCEKTAPLLRDARSTYTSVFRKLLAAP